MVGEMWGANTKNLTLTFTWLKGLKNKGRRTLASCNEVNAGFSEVYQKGHWR